MAKNDLPVESKPLSAEQMSPKIFSEFVQRGWAYLNAAKADKALEDFNKAIELDKTSSDAYYMLGLALKAMGRKEDAIDAFSKVLVMLDSHPNQNTRQMLTRLTKGHINHLQTGDWNLAKEIWQRK